VTPETFRKSVAKALEEIPEEFRAKMENVEVMVEDFADPETLDSVGLTSPWDLLGLYVGVPLTERSFFSPGYLPERIYLYRRPILRAAVQPENVKEIVRQVVVHEVGHHFGFNDDELEEMERRSD